MMILRATAAILLLGGMFGAPDRTVVAARSAQQPATVTITLVRWPFT